MVKLLKAAMHNRTDFFVQVKQGDYLSSTIYLKEFPHLQIKIVFYFFGLT